ncbi:hypothetical protein ISCGN_002478 [Ixodes scapularis]
MLQEAWNRKLSALPAEVSLEEPAETDTKKDRRRGSHHYPRHILTLQSSHPGNTNSSRLSRHFRQPYQQRTALSPQSIDEYTMADVEELFSEAHETPSSGSPLKDFWNATAVVVRGRCYRSQRKTGKPYSVSTTIAADGSISECSCQCAAKEGLCNHALALLRLIVLLKGQGYTEAPPEVTCTELPQQWRRPRGSQICAASVAELDWRSAREGGPSKAQGSRLYDARKRPRDLAGMQQAMHRLGNDLGNLGDSPFAKHLRTVQVLGTASMFGQVPEGSPISYQQPLTPHGFMVHVSPNIAPCGRDASSTALPSWPVLFPLSDTFGPGARSLSDAERSLFKELVLTPDQARQLEKNSRQQSKSATWKAARTNRLTASTFGAVLIRESWTDVGLRNLTEEKDLSRVRAVKHGITQEPHAVMHYEKTLRSRGHQIQTTCSGLMVNPSSPWLGASPDRRVFDPAETPPHGVVEVKCPYTMWNCATPDSKSFFVVKDAAVGLSARRCSTSFILRLYYPIKWVGQTRENLDLVKRVLVKLQE